MSFAVLINFLLSVVEMQALSSQVGTYALDTEGSIPFPKRKRLVPFEIL